MPSSPKLFHAQHRQSPASPRRSTVLILGSCLLIGIAGFIFGLAALLGASGAPHKCMHAEPRSVKVVWDRDRGGGDGGGSGLDPNSKTKRQKVMGFVGIQTGFGSVGRRRSLRQTWMPSDPQALSRYSFLINLDFAYSLWNCINFVNPYKIVYIYFRC